MLGTAQKLSMPTRYIAIMTTTCVFASVHS